jgi:hypothetical protein
MIGKNNERILGTHPGNLENDISNKFKKYL